MKTCCLAKARNFNPRIRLHYQLPSKSWGRSLMMKQCRNWNAHLHVFNGFKETQSWYNNIHHSIKLEKLKSYLATALEALTQPLSCLETSSVLPWLVEFTFTMNQLLTLLRKLSWRIIWNTLQIHNLNVTTCNLKYQHRFLIITTSNLL